MTLPSTEELQRLLDAATPGPWSTIEDRYTDRHGNVIYRPDEIVADAIEDDVPVMWNSDGAVDWTSKPGNPRLAALAPVLAAEVIRLRKENERMQERVNKHAQDALRLTKFLHDHHPAVHAEFKSNLTRILEGDQT